MEQNINNPLVSVIVSCYNHQNYIKECIESIVQQTYKNIELIVFDDGSKDESPQILEKLATKYNFIFVKQKNMGIAKTLNTAIAKYAKGIYISMCGSDDFYTKDRIEKQVAFMQQNQQYGLCYGDLYEVNEESKVVKILHSSKISGNLYKRFIHWKLNIPALSCFYKKEALISAGLFDESAKVEDIYMFIKILKLYEAGYLNEITAYYRRHNNNFSNTRVVEMYQENMRMIEKLFKNESFYKDIKNRNLVIWFYLVSKKDKKNALLMFSKIKFKYYFTKHFVGGCLNLIGFKC